MAGSRSWFGKSRRTRGASPKNGTSNQAIMSDPAQADSQKTVTSSSVEESSTGTSGGEWTASTSFEESASYHSSISLEPNPIGPSNTAPANNDSASNNNPPEYTSLNTVASTLVAPPKPPLIELPYPRSSRTCQLPAEKMVVRAVQNDKQGISNTQLFHETACSIPRPFNVDSGQGFSDTYFKVDSTFHWLMMKQEDIWFPLAGKGEASLRTLYEIGYTITHTDAICEHYQWDQEYPFLVPRIWNLLEAGFEDEARLASYALPISAVEHETEPVPELASKVHEQLLCVLFHQSGCNCDASTNWGVVRGCPRCYTDFSFNVTGATGKDRCFVFNVWKCLGTAERYSFDGELHCDYWRSHTDKRNRRLRSKTLGYMRGLYEGSGKNVHEPEMPRGYSLAVQTRFSWKREKHS